MLSVWKTQPHGDGTALASNDSARVTLTLLTRGMPEWGGRGNETAKQLCFRSGLVFNRRRCCVTPGPSRGNRNILDPTVPLLAAGLVTIIGVLPPQDGPGLPLGFVFCVFWPPGALVSGTVSLCVLEGTAHLAPGSLSLLHSMPVSLVLSLPFSEGGPASEPSGFRS